MGTAKFHRALEALGLFSSCKFPEKMCLPGRKRCKWVSLRRERQSEPSSAMRHQATPKHKKSLDKCVYLFRHAVIQQDKTESQVSLGLSEFFFTYSLILMLLISKLHGLTFSQACGWDGWLCFVRCWCPALLSLLGKPSPQAAESNSWLKCPGAFELKGLKLLTLFINYS